MSTALETLVFSSRESFLARQSDTSMNFEAEAGFAIQSLSSEYLMKVALANKQSVIDAVTNVSAIGISLNPAKKQAYLVPRKGKVCLEISYMGLIDLAVATGAIKWAQAAVVYTDDTFELRGFDNPPHHVFSPFAVNRGAIIGVYCVVKTADNEYLTHSMPISEVYSIRDRSEAWKADKATPWKTDEGEMIKKTCIKQAYKYWPRVNDRLQNAIQYLNTDGDQGLLAINNQAPTRNPNAVTEKEVVDIERLENLVASLELAAQSGSDFFKKVWRNLSDKDKAAVGLSEHDRIKAVADVVTQQTQGEKSD